MPSLVAVGDALGVSSHLLAHLIRFDIYLLTFSFQNTTHLAIDEHKIVSFEIAFQQALTHGNGRHRRLELITVDNLPTCLFKPTVNLYSRFFLWCHSLILPIF